MTFPVTKVTLTLVVKPWFIATLPVKGSMVAMTKLSKLKVTSNRASSSRLKLEVQRLIGGPFIKLYNYISLCEPHCDL